MPVLVLVAGNGVFLAEGNMSSDDAEGGGTSRILEVLHYIQLFSSVLHSFDLKELPLLVPTAAGALSSLQQDIVDDGHRLQVPRALVPARLRADPVRGSPELGEETAHETYLSLSSQITARMVVSEWHPSVLDWTTAHWLHCIAS